MCSGRPCPERLQPARTSALLAARLCLRAAREAREGRGAAEGAARGRGARANQNTPLPAGGVPSAASQSAPGRQEAGQWAPRGAA